MTFDPSNALHSGQGFFPPNLVAIGHCYANWPLLDPSWPLHDLWPHQCFMLWSEILSIKFGGHKAFLSNLTPGWPPAWLTPDNPYMTFDPSNALCFGQGFYSPNLVAIGHFQVRLTPGWYLTPGGVASKICPQTSWACPLPPCQLSARYLKAWRNA